MMFLDGKNHSENDILLKNPDIKKNIR